MSAVYGKDQKRLSAPQQRFLAALREAGGDGVRCPFTGNSMAKIVASAFHRTAESLQARGLVRIEREGDSIRVWEKEWQPHCTFQACPTCGFAKHSGARLLADGRTCFADAGMLPEVNS
jgi:hypothetical protein